MTRQADYQKRHGLKRVTVWMDEQERQLLERTAEKAGVSKKQAIVHGLQLLASGAPDRA